jgi:hypothetical protein
VQKFGDGFGRQCFANTRGTVQQEDATSSFAGNNIRERLVSVLDQSSDQLFFVGRQDEFIKGVFIIDDRFHEINAHFTPFLGAQRESINERPRGPKIFVVESEIKSSSLVYVTLIAVNVGI